MNFKMWGSSVREQGAVNFRSLHCGSFLILHNVLYTPSLSEEMLWQCSWDYCGNKCCNNIFTFVKSRHFSLKRCIHYLVAEIISNVKKCIFRDFIKESKHVFFLNKSVVMFYHNLFNRKVSKMCWQSKQLTCRTLTCRTQTLMLSKKVYGNEFVLDCVINAELFHKASHLPVQIFKSWGLGAFACVGLFVWVF